MYNTEDNILAALRGGSRWVSPQGGFHTELLNAIDSILAGKLYLAREF